MAFTLYPSRSCHKAYMCPTSQRKRNITAPQSLAHIETMGLIIQKVGRFLHMFPSTNTWLWFGFDMSWFLDQFLIPETFPSLAYAVDYEPPYDALPILALFWLGFFEFMMKTTWQLPVSWQHRLLRIARTSPIGNMPGITTWLPALAVAFHLDVKTWQFEGLVWGPSKYIKTGHGFGGLPCTRNQKEDLERKAKDKQPSPPGLRTLRWDRLSVFSYTNITFNSLFQKTPILSHLAGLNPETSAPALERKFPFWKMSRKIACEISPYPCSQRWNCRLTSHWILISAFPRNIDCRGPGILGRGA